MAEIKYNEYFEIDEMYFPCVDDSAIKADPECWKRTFPHSTFIEMLRSFERCLARREKSTLWIQGEYGTGKSQCAYTLKKILEVPENELREYWAEFKELNNYKALLESLVGHRNSGIVVAYRYASGSIVSPRNLFFAIQESVKASLREKGLYEGEDTLKESVIAWIDQPLNKAWIDGLLNAEDKPYLAMFAQSTADEILSDLRKGGEIKKLMDNIFTLADNEQITALNIDSDRLIAWLTDVIDNNNTKIVLVWDEFSDYFKANKESFTEFQKVAALVQYKPFYFVIVTHHQGQTYTGDEASWKTVRDRFIEERISLPDSISLSLIGKALKRKKGEAEKAWSWRAEALNGQLNYSRSAVMKEIGISDPQIIKDIMPLHPMTALVLMNIASAFESNQRSMFEFIQRDEESDLRAFQWFISEYGPDGDHPLLTVDMLWDFFYVKGKDNLTSDIRLILDTLPQQKNLRADEEAVLKAILIMQAIDQRQSGLMIGLLKPTDQNLGYVFEGLSARFGLDSRYKGLAKGLVDKKILIQKPLPGGNFSYAAAVLAGDQSKIDEHKNEVLRIGKTDKLVTDGGLASVLKFDDALRLRYGSDDDANKAVTVTVHDFKDKINRIRDKYMAWRFCAVIAFAKDDTEIVTLRKQVREMAEELYKNDSNSNIVLVDALSTPLGLDAFREYADFAAMASFYNGNDKSASSDQEQKALNILSKWKDRISDGQFVVYSYYNREGEKVKGHNDVKALLKTVIYSRFQYAFDLLKGLSENQLKLTNAKQSARYGIDQEGTGSIKGAEKAVFPKGVWKVEENYWESNPTLGISKIKVRIDKMIESSLRNEGKISIGEIYDFLEEEYGFAPCNLSAFLTGFLLKEYSGEPYRYVDSEGMPDSMSPGKLAEMIFNYIGKSPKPTYIVKMNDYEKSFYTCTENAWRIPENTLSSVSQAVARITEKMRGLKFPVWCLSLVDENSVFDLVQMYIELVQLDGKTALGKAVEIGKIAIKETNQVDLLKSLLTEENCQKGMREFLKTFEGGKILSLAEEIGASENVLTDIRGIFSSVDYFSYWLKSTGENEIRKLLTDYGFVKETNVILNTNAHSKMEAFKEWREQLKFSGVSCEVIMTKYPALAKIFDSMLRICRQEDISLKLKDLHLELMEHGAVIRDLLSNINLVFTEVYKPYLDGLNDEEISEVKNKVGIDLFELPKTRCNEKVKEEADKLRKNQLRTQMTNLWYRKTRTKNPRDWSERYGIPILSCVNPAEFDIAKKTFDTLNSNFGSDAEIKFAIEFLSSTSLFEVLNDENNRNTAFVKDIFGDYKTLLPDVEDVRRKLENMSVDVYDWRGNPAITKKIKDLAEAEYDAGGSDKAISKIDEMTDDVLRDYLKGLVKEKKNIKVGIAIIEGGSE